MTNISFYYHDNFITGFLIVGHSTKNANDINGKVICSAISSSAYMAVNTLTEIVKANVKTNVTDGEMKIEILDKIKESQVVLSGLKLHLVELSKDYPENITINSEV